MKTLQQELFVAYLQNGGKLSVKQIAEFSADPVYNMALAQFVHDKLFATTQDEPSSDAEHTTVKNTIEDEIVPSPKNSEDDETKVTSEAVAPAIDAEPIQIPEWCFIKLDDPSNPLFNNPNYSKESLEDLKIIKSRAKSIGIKYVGQLVETDFAKLSGGVNERIEMLKRRIKALYGIEVGTKIPGFAEAIADEVAQFKA